MLTERGFHFFAKVGLLILSIYIWVRPLFFGYHEPFFFDVIQFTFLFVDIVLLAGYIASLKPRKMKLFFIVPFLMFFYPLFHNQLKSEAEIIFFNSRKIELKEIVSEVNFNPEFEITADLENKLKKNNIYNIEIDSNYIAFSVNSIIDNTDGFVFVKSGEVPKGMFEGNLVYKEKIENEENWYSFSTR